MNVISGILILIWEGIQGVFLIITDTIRLFFSKNKKKNVVKDFIFEPNFLTDFLIMISSYYILTKYGWYYIFVVLCLIIIFTVYKDQKYDNGQTVWALIISTSVIVTYIIVIIVNTHYTYEKVGAYNVPDTKKKYNVEVDGKIYTTNNLHCKVSKTILYRRILTVNEISLHMVDYYPLCSGKIHLPIIVKDGRKIK